MAKRELPTKFGLDPCNGFPETWVYGRTDGRTTDDGRLRHDSSSADEEAHEPSHFTSCK